MLDFFGNFGTVIEFTGLYIKETFKMFNEDCFQYLLSGAEPPEECLPDYTGLQTLCQENDMDYFTLSFSQTCDDGSSLDVQDMPQCLPSSCTSDEATLKAMLADMTSDESDTDSGPVCAISDFILSGLATINVSTASPTSQSSPTPPELFKASKKSKKEGEAAKKASKKAKNNKTSKKTKKVGSNGGD